MIDIPPEVKRINQLLIDHYGLDTSTGQPVWRVVWSDDQYEKRLMDTTDEGLTLLYPEVREVPKYKQWVVSKWTLEQLVIIPEINNRELPATRMSYEPMFPFEDNQGNALPPKFEVCKFIIDLVYAARGKTSMAKYKEPSQEESLELKRQRVDQLVVDIFGDETDVSDHLSRKTGVVIANTDYQIKES